ncbi:hypothetical protein HK104_008237 [Borealophlyctis nickersoniae]|nr:hypothetical protein HK104_008237 [Borealophlyctis nickersoniae]
MMALTQNVTTFQPGFEKVSTSISACVPYYPVVDVTDNSGYSVYAFRNWFARSICGLESYGAAEKWLKENACPISAIPIAKSRGSGHVPPFLVLQGGNDNIVNKNTVRHFVKVLGELDKDAIFYMEMPRAHHAFDGLSSPRSNVANWAVAEFLNGVHARWVENRLNGVAKN